MSTSIALDPRELLITQLEAVAPSYVSDLSHIPADKLTQSPMGVARSPQDFTAEIIGFNHYVADALAGIEHPARTEEEFIAKKAQYDTFDKMKAGVEESIAHLKSVISGLSDDDLGKTVKAPWGAELPAFRLASIVSYHMMYHDGQINYIQALYGDGEMHW